MIGVSICHCCHRCPQKTARSQNVSILASGHCCYHTELSAACLQARAVKPAINVASKVHVLH